VEQSNELGRHRACGRRRSGLPAAAANLTNTNDLPDGTSFHSITIDGDNYAIGGHSIALTNGLAINGAANGISLAITATASQTWSTSYGCTGCTYANVGAVYFGANTLTLRADRSNADVWRTLVGSGPLIVNGTAAVSTLNVNLGPVTMNGIALSFIGGSTGDVLITHGNTTARVLTSGNIHGGPGYLTCGSPGGVSSRNVSLSPGSMFELSFATGTIPMLGRHRHRQRGRATLAFNSPARSAGGAHLRPDQQRRSDRSSEGSRACRGGDVRFERPDVHGFVRRWNRQRLHGESCRDGHIGTTTTVISSQNPAVVRPERHVHGKRDVHRGTPTGERPVPGRFRVTCDPSLLMPPAWRRCTKSSLTLGSHSIAVLPGARRLCRKHLVCAHATHRSRHLGAVRPHNPASSRGQWRSDLSLLNTGPASPPTCRSSCSVAAAP